MESERRSLVKSLAVEKKSGSGAEGRKVYHLTRKRCRPAIRAECHGSRPTRVGNYSAAQLRFQTELLIV